MATLYDFPTNSLVGQPIDLNSYREKVLLIVNVASKCGFTPQYAGLEKIYKKYKDQGFEILGFPCNQFGAQEPGDASEISKFCTQTYDVSFSIFEKIEVNGANTHPLYKWMKSRKPGIAGTTIIKWNFTKFLVDRKGDVVSRFGPKDKPESLEQDIVKLL